MPGLHGGDDVGVLAHGVFEAREEHAVDLHAVVADGLFLDAGQDVGAQVLVVAVVSHRTVIAAVVGALHSGARQLQHFVVIELGLEVFAVGKKVEQLEGGFLGPGDAGLDGVVEQLLAKVVLAGATALDLDEIGGREDGAKQAQVQDVGAVVAGGHHAHGHAHPRLAGLVGGDEIAGAKQVVVGKVDGELLGVLNL